MANQQQSKILSGRASPTLFLGLIALQVAVWIGIWPFADLPWPLGDFLHGLTGTVRLIMVSATGRAAYFLPIVWLAQLGKQPESRRNARLLVSTAAVCAFATLIWRSNSMRQRGGLVGAVLVAPLHVPQPFRGLLLLFLVLLSILGLIWALGLTAQLQVYYKKSELRLPVFVRAMVLGVMRTWRRLRPALAGAKERMDLLRSRSGPEPTHHASHIQSVEPAIGDHQPMPTGRDRNLPDALRHLIVTPTLDYHAVAGMGALKARLEIAIEGALDAEIRHVVERVTGRPSRDAGILLYGCPGNGKSFIATATAGEFARRHPLTVINAGIESVKSLHWSKQIARLSAIFDLAADRAPSLTIWDEIDGIVSDPQSTGRKYDAERSTLFKQRLEGAFSTRGLMLHIATTNSPHLLELPLLRQGRFGTLVHVPPPDFAARRELIHDRLAEMWLDEPIEATELAHWTVGNTVSEILGFLDEVGRRVVMTNLRDRRNQHGIRWVDLEAARQLLDRKSYPAWLANIQAELSKPRNRGKREYFADLADLRGHVPAPDRAPIPQLQSS